MKEKYRALAYKCSQILVGFLLVCTLCTNQLCAQRSPRFDYFFLEASKCMREQDVTSAAELFTHCFEIDSTAAEALYAMSLVNFYLQNQDSIGTHMLERACQLDSSNSTYLNTLAKVYLSQRNTDKVIPTLERLSHLQTRRTDVLGQLVDVYQSVDRNDKAIETLNRMELIEGLTEEIAYKKANVYTDMGLHDSARAEILRLCESFPHETGYKLTLVSNYIESGDVAKAKNVLEEVQHDEPQYPGLPSAWLYFYQHTDEVRYKQVRDSILLSPATTDETRCMLLNTYAREAIRDTIQASSLQAIYDTLTTRPDCTVSVLLSKAAWLAREGEYEAPVANTLQQVLKKDPGNEAAIRYLTIIYAHKNDTQGLEDVCRRGEGYFPGKFIYPYYLATILVKQDKNDEAIATLTQGLKVRDADTDKGAISDAYALLGDLYHEQDKIAESFAAYDSSLVYNSENITCLNNYAYFLSLTGKQLDEAEEMSYRTVVLEPRNIIYLDTYAWILFTKGKFTEARIYMNRAINPELSDKQIMEIEDANANILEHAGDIHAKCGDMEQALRMWRLAQSKNDGTSTKRLGAKIKKRKYLQP